MERDGLNANDAAKVLGVSRRTMFRGLKAFATTTSWCARERYEPPRGQTEGGRHLGGRAGLGRALPAPHIDERERRIVGVLRQRRLAG